MSHPFTPLEPRETHPDAEWIQREWLDAADDARAAQFIVAALGCGVVLLIVAGLIFGFLKHFGVL